LPCREHPLPDEARRINPFEYLADVLARVQEHRARNIDALLLGAWVAARNDDRSPAVTTVLAGHVCR
jgi:hypothetical protein